MQTNLNHINLSTGPVSMHPEVVRAFQSSPEPHRSDLFMACFHELTLKLTQLTKAGYAFVLSGSGSLGNEAITAYIKSENTPGLVLSNGEFGERLISQCTAQQVPFTTYRIPWGMEFELSAIEKMLHEHHYAWIYFVHCESSTGCINDYQALISICKKCNVKIYMDVMSSIGNRDIDLSEVTMASASSGKGLGAFPGLSIVFTKELPKAQSGIPTYLNLHHYHQKQGVPFTISTNLVRALHTSLSVTDFTKHFSEISAYSKEVMNIVGQVPGIDLLNNNYSTLSHIITCRPQHTTSMVMGNVLLERGIQSSFSSGYQKENNLLQFAVMGYHNDGELEYLRTALLEHTSLLS